jgi:hypothetical protein
MHAGDLHAKKIQASSLDVQVPYIGSILIYIPVLDATSLIEQVLIIWLHCTKEAASPVGKPFPTIFSMESLTNHPEKSGIRMSNLIRRTRFGMQIWFGEFGTCENSYISNGSCSDLQRMSCL